MKQEELDEIMEGYKALCRIFRMEIREEGKGLFTATATRANMGELQVVIETPGLAITCIAPSGCRVFTLLSNDSPWSADVPHIDLLQKTDIPLVFRLCEIWRGLEDCLENLGSHRLFQIDELGAIYSRRLDAPQMVELLARLMAFYSYSDE